MDSADPVDTIAMKSMTNIRAQPAVPSNSEAQAGGTKPLPASSEVMGSMRAVDARPREVAREKGMENQQILETQLMSSKQAGRQARVKS